MDEIDFFRQRYEIFPKQYISYQRAAYFGKENADFRLTFDRALTGRRSDLSLRQQSYGDLLIREQMSQDLRLYAHVAGRRVGKTASV